MRMIMIIGVVVGLLLLGACAQQADPTPVPTPAEIGKQVVVADKGSYRQISPSELQAMLSAGGMTLVNVHIPYQGEIEPTDLILAYNEIAQKTDQLLDKTAKIVLYCKSGAMSTQAAVELVGLGYTHIYELQGGMDAWEAAGLPLKK